MVLESKLEHVATRGALTLIAIAIVVAVGWLLWPDTGETKAEAQDPPAVQEPDAGG